MEGAKRMYEEGESLSEIARRYGMPRTTLGRVLHLAGVPGMEHYNNRRGKPYGKPNNESGTIGPSGIDFSQKTGRDLAQILNDLEDELKRRGYYKDEQGNWYVRQYLLRESIRKGL